MDYLYIVKENDAEIDRNTHKEQIWIKKFKRTRCDKVRMGTVKIKKEEVSFADFNGKADCLSSNSYIVDYSK